MASSGTSLVGNVSDLLGQAEAEKSKGRNVKQELDKDAFLTLLVTQLKNQDPTKPMDNTEFISQMAQFSSLEQMQNMNKALENQANFGALAQASSLIGKEVTVVTPGEDANTIIGEVTEVRHSGGDTYVVVNGQQYEASMISSVTPKGTFAAKVAAGAEATSATPGSTPITPSTDSSADPTTAPAS